MSRKVRRGHVSHERWLVSYADFMTLLFALFVVMFASSQRDKNKMQTVQSSIRAAFQTMGIFTRQDPNSKSAAMIAPKALMLGDDVASLPAVMDDLNNLKRKMERVLAPQIANGTVTVTIGRAGLLISLRDAGFFESGSAVPIASSLPALNAIGRAIATTPYDVRIEGHTDNVPIRNGQFASNWELSTTRATVLTHLFLENDHVVPSRLSAAGYAQYHPVASNLTAEGRSRNRRVDIIVEPTRQQAVMMDNLAAERNASAVSSPKDKGQRKLQKFLWKASHSEILPTTPPPSGPAPRP
jgi:chemotaxis protein MotB